MTWTQVGPNLVTDGELEYWDDANTLTHWGDNSGPVQESSDVYEGTYACALTITTRYISQDSIDYPDGAIFLTSGADYELSLYHKHSGNSYITLQLQAYDADDNTIGTLNLSDGLWYSPIPYDDITAESAWTQFKLRFKGHSSASVTKYYFNIIQARITSGTILLDKIEIYAVEDIPEDTSLHYNSDSKTISIAENTFVYGMGGGGTAWRPMLTTASESFEWSRGGWYKLYADAGKSIGGYWTSKRLDFSDQFPQYSNHWKTVDKVKIEYVDEVADTPMTVSLTTDGGVTWVSKTRVLGTGNGKQKSALFHFKDSELSTSKYFNMRIESISTTTSFTWTGFYIYFEPRGEYFTL